MKVYQTLVFRGPQAALDRLVLEIEGRLSDGWSRSHEAEVEIARAALGAMYCFCCSASGSRPSGELWLVERSDGTLYVSTINIADSTAQKDVYNAVLTEFYNQFGKPAADALKVQVELSKPDLKIEDFLSPQAVKLLRSFSRLANRSFLHSHDRTRWNEFLAVAYRERTSLDPDLLKRWLIEEERWSEESAFHLVTEYAHARELLKVYEAQHV